ncbi:ABC transporter substrate-binding protein [Muricoccus pecuniae]|uniref:Peptide/nickel transport system substrate-binding protein n=1 Tax=Muricoccus pecuniae TaxID=693023 RepID=A0A840Y424_9PROT|nr:ABC transporter substrate-binding protein [Roseomonas pecuniae]MBB5695475.1 peptide/nickel transport system substrate-binding protein [Roseomonas pecuniae]
MRTALSIVRPIIFGTALLSGVAGAQGATVLNIGLAGDPGSLDPAQSGNFIDRNVFAAICDKLIDTDAEMNYVPQLATRWEWSDDRRALTLYLRDGVTFHDGTAFDAEAVKINLDRFRTMPRSLRRAELAALESVEVLDPRTVRLRLSVPSAPLLAVLADRSGMMLSPAAIQQRGDGIGQHPVCAGPFTFTERVAQDRIVVDRFGGYWNASAIMLDRIVYRPITDSTVRLLNLRSGQLQIIDQVAPTDVPDLQSNRRLRLARHVAAAYRTLQFNVAHGPRADTPLGRDPRLRRAFEKAIDREAINQVVFNGLFVPSNQTESPRTRYWNPDHPVGGADIAGSRALLRQAGVARVAFTLQIANTPIDAQIGEVIQSMAREAGFDVKLEQVESNAGNQKNQAGDFDAALLTWSGRSDPDANLSIWFACNGPFNFGRYCNPRMEALLTEARGVADPAIRLPLYRQVVNLYHTDVPHVILYHYTWLWGLSDRVENFVPNADGLIRMQGLRLRP